MSNPNANLNANPSNPTVTIATLIQQPITQMTQRDFCALMIYAGYVASGRDKSYKLAVADADSFFAALYS